MGFWGGGVGKGEEGRRRGPGVKRRRGLWGEGEEGRGGPWEERAGLGKKEREGVSPKRVVRVGKGWKFQDVRFYSVLNFDHVGGGKARGEERNTLAN